MRRVAVLAGWDVRMDNLEEKARLGLYQLVPTTNHPGHLATGLLRIVNLFQAHRSIGRDGDA